MFLFRLFLCILAYFIGFVVERRGVLLVIIHSLRLVVPVMNTLRLDTHVIFTMQVGLHVNLETYLFKCCLMFF